MPEKRGNIGTMGGAGDRSSNDQNRRHHYKEPQQPKSIALSMINRSDPNVNNNVNPTNPNPAMTTIATTASVSAVLPSSPQPPRISISATERKRMIRSRRRYHPSENYPRCLGSNSSNMTDTSCSNGDGNGEHDRRVRHRHHHHQQQIDLCKNRGSGKRSRELISSNCDILYSTANSVLVPSATQKSVGVSRHNGASDVRNHSGGDGDESSSNILSTSSLLNNNNKSRNNSTYALIGSSGGNDGRCNVSTIGTSLFANLGSNDELQLQLQTQQQRPQPASSSSSKSNPIITQPSREVVADAKLDADATTAITPTHYNNNATINTDQPTPKSLPQPPPLSSIIMEDPLTPSFFGNVMKRSTQSEPPKTHSFNPTLQRSISSFFSSPLSQPPVIQNLSFDGEDQKHGMSQEQDNASNRWALSRRPRGIPIMINQEKVWDRFADTTDSPSSMTAAVDKSIPLSSPAIPIPITKSLVTNQTRIDSSTNGYKNSTLGCSLERPFPARSENPPARCLHDVEMNNLERLSSNSNSCATTVITTAAATPRDQFHKSINSDHTTTCTQMQQTRRTLVKQRDDKPTSSFLPHDRNHNNISDNKKTLSYLKEPNPPNGSDSKQVGVEGKEKRETSVPPPSPSSSPFLFKINHNAISTSMRMASPQGRRAHAQDTDILSTPSSSRSRRRQARVLSPQKLDWNPATPERCTQIADTTTTATFANATSAQSRKSIIITTSAPSLKNSALSSTGVSDYNHLSTPDDGQRRMRQQRRLQDQRYVASSTTSPLHNDDSNPCTPSRSSTITATVTSPLNTGSTGAASNNNNDDSNRVNWHPSTPQISDNNNSNHSLKTAQSPGGFALLQILDSCKNDGWNYHYNHKSRNIYNEADNDNNDDDDDDDDVKAEKHTKKSTKHNTIKVKDNDEDETMATHSKFSSSSQGGGSNGLEDWEEASIRLPSLGEGCHTVDRYDADDCNRENNDSPFYSPVGEVGIIDWSIKRWVEIQCHPNCCQPGSYSGRDVNDDNEVREVNPHLSRCYNEDNSSRASDASWGWDSLAASMSDQTIVERLAMRLLQDPISSPVTLGSVSKDVMIQAQWQAGLMYWQHPSMHPLPPSLRNKSSNIEKSLTSGIKHNKNRGKFSFSSISSSTPVNTLLKRQSSLPASCYSKQTNNIHDPSHPYYSRSVSASSSSPISIMTTNNGHLLEKLEHYTKDRGRRAGLGCLGGLGRSGGVRSISRVGGENHDVNNNTSSLSALLEQRESEWQESFRSMFFAWMGKIQEFQCRLSRHVEGGVNGVEKDGMRMQSITNELNRIYFYSVSPEQTILFRAAISSHGGLCGCGQGSGIGDNFKGECDSQTANPMIKKLTGKCTIVPFIIMSSSTSKMRSILKSMGVKLMVNKKDWNHEYAWSSKKSTKHQQCTEFKEGFIDDWLQCGIKKVNDVDDLVVSEDLEALRRDNSVGAEVNVSLQRRNKSNHSQRSLRKFPPLSLSGPDNCLAFFEFFMNTCGNRLRSSRLESDRSFIDVPLLLCRSIGPCRHTSLRNLCTSRRSNVNNTTTANVEGKENVDPFSTHSASCVELRGPILPCSSRDLTCAAVSHLLFHKKKDSVENKSIDNHHLDGKMNDKPMEERVDTLGSHYFVMNSLPHEGEEEESLLSKVIPRARNIGVGGPLFFNGLGAYGTNLDERMRECSEGCVVGMTVWDVARSHTIACQSSLVSETMK